MWNYVHSLVIFVILCAGFCQTRRLGRGEHSLHHNMDQNELKRFFGTSVLSEVPEYEIAHPFLSNEKGVEIKSDEPAKFQTDLNVRQRRSIPNEETGTRYYNLNAFGLKLHLSLTQNKVFGPKFIVENRQENGSRITTTPEIDDHFIGSVVSHPGSIISISAGKGLTGMIKLPHETFYLQPLSDNLAQKYIRSISSYPHVVMKASSDKKTFIPCDVEDDFSSPIVKRSVTNNSVPTNSDPLLSHKYLQTVYVVDQYLLANFGQSTLERLLPSLANIVAARFRDTSFGSIKLNYVLNKIIFLNNNELSYAANASTYTKLNHIRQWAAANNAQSDPDHFDTVTLLSSGKLGGRGVLGTICASSSTANIVNLAGLNTAATIAHEVFHNIGYNHDTTKECPDLSYIMATVIPAGPAAFTWSTCSRDFVQSFLNSDASNCLDDPPSPTLQRPTEPSLLISKLPGVVYDANKQCEYVHGTSLYKKCPGKQNQCDSLYCTNDFKRCHTNFAPPLDGTRCGVRHWCIKGVCVDDGSPLIDGNWGGWTNYSECTKQCDIGVAYQSRTCDNPSPQNGGEDCEGSLRGNYKTCNTQECPENSVSFRQMQCQAKGEYSEYTVSSEPCSLVCRSGSSIYWLGTTIDGTRCSNQKEDLDVCVEGHCKEVGCDYNLGSGKRFDRCKVCGGDGSSCALNVVNYTKSYNKYGYENADVMVTLPVHTTNVVAVQKAAGYNQIGIQTTEGEYLIVHPTWSKTIEEAGTTITYIHEDNRYPDRIYIPGPTQYELNLVFIYLYERPQQGVDISYYAPTVTPIEVDFEWVVSDWSACSRSCAGGLRGRNVICVRKDDKTEVGHESCDELTKPNALESCSTQPCPPEWYITAWQTCSLSCGKGFQQRHVVCRQKIAENKWNTITNETLCIEPKPVVSPLERNCNEISCPPEYVAGQWSECSTTCSLGVMTRQLTCQRRTATSTTEHLPNLWCEDYGSIKPAVTEDCNADSPCEPPPENTIGCFVLDVNIFPTVLANFQETIDYENTLVTARSCARLAFHQNYRYFGLANNGECRVGPDIKSNFFKPATSSKCYSSVGQTGAIFVYTLDELPTVTPVGCYKDKYHRAMPVLYKNFRNQIDWYSMKSTVSQCAHVAYERGFHYFGVQFYGECWSGALANETYDTYGETTTCWEGVGQEWTNFVYRFD